MLFTDAQFTCLVDKYIDTVFRVALNYLKVSADAEDIRNPFSRSFCGSGKSLKVMTISGIG